MKIYIASLGAGVLVGVLYALMGVRSPAPPVVALLGLLGMLAGEQIPDAVRQAVKGEWPTFGLSAAVSPVADTDPQSPAIAKPDAPGGHPPASPS